jgi:hypothetical protein
MPLITDARNMFRIIWRRAKVSYLGHLSSAGSRDTLSLLDVTGRGELNILTSLDRRFDIIKRKVEVMKAPHHVIFSILL